MQILIIEDDPTFRHLISTYLARSGHQVELTEDGIKGHRMARMTHPDLVVLDYRLPDVDGLVVAEWLAESSRGAEIPIILLIGAEPGDVDLERMSGSVVDVLHKQTLTEEELSSSIEKVFLSQPSSTALFPGR